MIFDATPYFAAKRANVENSRRRRHELAPHYIVAMLRDISIDELRNRLVGTGLIVSESLGQTIIHRGKTPPEVA